MKKLFLFILNVETHLTVDEGEIPMTIGSRSDTSFRTVESPHNSVSPLLHPWEREGLRVREQNIRLKRDLENQLRTHAVRQEVLVDLGRLVVEQSWLDPLFEQATRELAEVLGVEFAHVLEFDAEASRFLLRAGVGWEPERVGVATVEHGPVPEPGFSVLSKKAVMIESVDRETRFYASPFRPEHGIGGGMSVVVEGRNRPFGVLGVHTRSWRSFSDDDVSFLRSVAHLLSNAVERRLAQEAEQKLSVQLAHQKNRLDDILRKVPVVVWELRLEPGTDRLLLEYVSGYVEQMLGFSERELEEQPELWRERIHPDDIENVEREMGLVMKGGQREPVRFRWLARDGSVVWVESIKQAFFDRAGNPTGMRGVASDITTRKIEEDKRRAAEERFHAFMDNSPLVALVKDDQGRYVYANLRFQAWCQSQGRRWDGVTDYDLFSPDVARRYREHDQAALKENATTQMLETSVENGEAPRYWTVLRFPIPDSSGRRFLGLVSIEITERRRLEREILEISDREQRKLGQELHDGLCQHLLGIGMMSRTLFERMSQKGLPEATEVEKICGFLEDALGLTRGLMQGFHLVNVEGPGGLSAALKEFSRTTTGLFGKRCEFHSSIEVLVKDESVASHLFRIAQEAMHNAVKHGDSAQVAISLERDGDSLLLTVENDGNSLPDSLGNSPGMGLRTMKYRAGLIGADLWFENRAGGGVIVSCRIRAGHKRGIEMIG